MQNTYQMHVSHNDLVLFKKDPEGSFLFLENIGGVNSELEKPLLCDGSA